MSTRIDLRELPARLDEALAIVAAGGEVLLTEGPTPRARLVPWRAPARACRACTPARSKRPPTSTRRCRRTSGPAGHEAAARHPRLHLVGQRPGAAVPRPRWRPCVTRRTRCARA